MSHYDIVRSVLCSRNLKAIRSCFFENSYHWSTTLKDQLLLSRLTNDLPGVLELAAECGFDICRDVAYSWGEPWAPWDLFGQSRERLEWYLDMDPITVTGNCNFKTGSVSAFWLKAMYRMNNDVFNQLRQAGMYFDVEAIATDTEITFDAKLKLIKQFNSSFADIPHFASSWKRLVGIFNSDDAAFWDENTIRRFFHETHLDINVRSWSLKRTFLIRLSQHGTVASMTCLLDLGADLNAQDADGVTAIMLACKGKNFEVIELLQKRGARLDIKDNLGKDAFDWSKPTLQKILDPERKSRCDKERKEHRKAKRKAAPPTFSAALRAFNTVDSNASSIVASGFKRAHTFLDLDSEEDNYSDDHLKKKINSLSTF